METAFSVGYQGRNLAELVTRLAEQSVTVLVDVRERAWSHRPEFRKGRLAQALEDAGIRYLHLKSLGNPFRPQNGFPAERDECLRQYRDHLETAETAIEELRQITVSERAAVLCYERKHGECHRSALFEMLGCEHLDIESSQHPLF